MLIFAQLLFWGFGVGFGEGENKNDCQGIQNRAAHQLHVLAESLTEPLGHTDNSSHTEILENTLTLASLTAASMLIFLPSICDKFLCLSRFIS